MINKKTLIILVLLFITMLKADTFATEKNLISALKGGVKTTKEFLKKVPTYQLYEEDKSILHYAVNLRKYDVIDFLISQDVELYRRGGLYYQTALQDAIFNQYFRIAILLINSGSPLDIKNIDGDTALHIAARNGYGDIIKALLNAGASKNIYNNHGDTPFDLLPKFMMDNNKELKALLKPDKRLKLNKEQTKKTTIAVSHEMDRGQADFVLDKMYFDEQVGTTINDVTQSKGSYLEIINDTSMENSNVGTQIYTH